jgi:two-component sensor histidine kinase
MTSLTTSSELPRHSPQPDLGEPGDGNEARGRFPIPRARRFGLRFRLLLVVGIALLPVLLLSILQTVGRYQVFSENQRELLSARAQITAQDQRQVIFEAGAAMRALAQQSPVRLMGSALCAGALMRALEDQPAYSNMIRVNSAGVLSCSARVPDVLTNFADSDWIQDLRGGADFTVGAMEFDTVDNEAILRAAVPITDQNGAYAGALATNIRVSALQRLGRARAEGAIIGLVDRTGQVVTESVDLGMARVDAEYLDAAVAERLVQFQRAGPGGGQRIYVLAPLVSNELFALLSEPAPGLLDFAFLDLAGSVFLPLAMYFLALTAIWLSADLLVLRWLTYLRRLAAAYGHGRYSIRPMRARFAPGEMRELAETFGWMARSIAERDEQLNESLEHKQMLIKEIHHRVKNNLQIITSLINLQMKSVDDPSSRRVLGDAQTRINALALVHRSLYEAGDLGRIDLKPFFSELCALTHAAAGGNEQGIRLEVELERIVLDAERAIPLSLFVTEAMTNAYKHAFTDRQKGRIKVRLTRCEPKEGDPEPGENGLACAFIEDDGVGETGAAEPGRKGVGSSLFSAFARQLGGVSDKRVGEGGGHCVEVRFPLLAGEGEPGSDQDV